MSERFNGWDMAELRRRLRLRAGVLHRDKRINVRFDASDLVNDTFLRAAETKAFPAGLETPEQRLCWLMAVMDNLMIDKYREEQAQRRDVRREQGDEALRASLLDSSLAPGVLFADDGPGPVEIASRREQLELALEKMNEDERAIVRARLAGNKFREIAESLNRPIHEVTKLYYGALEKAAG